jgi:hypothetical protein
MRKAILIVFALLASIVLSATPANSDTWWQPKASEKLTLHWNLGGAINVNNARHIGERALDGVTVLPRPKVLDIDGADNSAATVATLHARGQKVICYFDAGVYEDYRSDAWKFPAEVIGNPDEGWDGSWWLDIRRLDVLLPIMEARVKMCADKGFDAIEPDEIDGWENDTGFPLTYNDQLVYNRAIAALAHKYNLAAVQKGDIIQTRDLVNYFDATLNEECVRYKECRNPWNPDTGQTQAGLQAYTAQDKAVWLSEYRNTDYSPMCKQALNNGWMAAQYKLGLPLNGGRKPC